MYFNIILSNKNWDLFWRQFAEKGAWKNVLQGLGTTAEIAILGLIIGIVIGTLIAIVKVVPKYKTLPKILEAIANVYVGLFRGTPMVVQLLIGYFILFPALGLTGPRLNIITSPKKYLDYGGNKILKNMLLIMPAVLNIMLF